MPPRSEKAACPVSLSTWLTPIAPQTPYLQEASLLLAEGQVPFLRIPGLLTSPLSQYLPQSLIMTSLCQALFVPTVCSALWRFLIESSTLKVCVVTIPGLREVKSFSQDHIAGEGISAS